jgi:hypothetical protein
VTGLPNFAGAKFDGVDGVDGLGAARWADVSSDGAHVYVAGILDASVAVFALTVPQVPALGPWGVGALGCLLIVAAGIARRRRFGSAS